MVSIERIKTNHMLIDDLDMWDEFTIKSLDESSSRKYYNELMKLINRQLNTSCDWLDSEEAKEYFINESKYHKDVFNSLENEWDNILSEEYDSIDELLDNLYHAGKVKGYSDMREHVKYTNTDKLALAFARKYNYNLINNIDEDLRGAIKDKITRAVLEGENPRAITSSILDLSDNQLEGSTFTPRQRAVMIARTETARVQNTGMLQSYINEGYTEVKILTAEDDKVCYTCLDYAYKFNKDDDIIYSNAGEEKVHNIQDLINGGSFPPFHPNCRCTYLCVHDSRGKPPEDPYTVNLTPTLINNTNDKNISNDVLNSMSFDELATYYGGEYQGIQTYEYDGKKYHTFTQTFDNGKTLTIRMEQGAVKSYAKKGVATPNEIISEVYKVPTALKRETNEIWFKNNNNGIQHTHTKSGYDSLSPHLGGYNTQYHPMFKGKRGSDFSIINDVDHCIVINPKYFKGASGKYAPLWEKDVTDARDWKHTIHHEFTHSIDLSREAFDNYSPESNSTVELSYTDEYMSIHKQERDFTRYANTDIKESFAEHGGYVSRMLANPSEQDKLINLELRGKDFFGKKQINFEQYKKLYPQHYEYFTKLLRG